MKKILNLMILCGGISVLIISFSCGKGDSKPEVTAKAKYTDMVTMAKISSDSKQGQVTMSHKKHALKKVKCTVCHHRKENPKNVKDCISCHKDKKGDEKIMHTLCVECHKKQKQGPVKCLQCHKKK